MGNLLNTYTCLMKKSLLLALLLLASASGFVKADGMKSGKSTNVSDKDSLAFSQALTNKKYGIGINPLRTIIYLGNALNVRGAVSLFAIDRHAEIAFPIQYLSGSDENIPYRFFFGEIAYRRFFSNRQNGFYYSGGFRYAFMKSEILDDSKKFGTPEEHTGTVYKQNKSGIYAGIGYRHFSVKGFYWGSNFILGGYFDNKSPYILAPEDFAYNFILGFELQIGYAF